MKIFEKPKGQTKLQETRDGLIGLILFGTIGWFAWGWVMGGEEKLTVEQAAAKAEAGRLEEIRRADALAEGEAAARARSQAKFVAERAAAKQLSQEKNLGFHCLSPWDGSHRALVDGVKSVLNDPNSFEHAETKTGWIDDVGRNLVVMRYRAKNGFGGVMPAEARGSFDNVTCDLSIDSVQ